MQNRVQDVLSLLATKEIDAFFTLHPLNVRYLTGFTGSNGLVYVSPKRCLFLTDKRYEEQVKMQVSGFEIFVPEAKPLLDNFIEKYAAEFAENRVGFEAEHVSCALYAQIIEKVDPVRLQMTQGLIESLRIVKSPDEITLIKTASHIVDKTFSQIVEYIRPGLTEIDVAAQIEYLMKKNGGAKAAFETIVASGPNGAWPHARPTDRVIATGDLVTLDMGCYYKGYASDMTRTVVIGPATDKQREVYNTVREAQARATHFAAPDKSYKDTDAAARDYITAAGYGDFFKHSLGHGVGLDVHEAPRLAKESDGSLSAGMTITNEPGIYLPNWGGVRIEDVLLITPSGSDVLHQSTKDLIEINV